LISFFFWDNFSVQVFVVFLLLFLLDLDLFIDLLYFYLPPCEPRFILFAISESLCSFCSFFPEAL